MRSPGGADSSTSGSPGFTFPLEPAELFEERATQMAGWGIRRSTVTVARRRIRDMWGEGEGSWVGEWGREAERAEGEGEWLQAALLWGAARFPSLATESRRSAYERQLAAYERAAPDFQLHFERLVLEVESGNGSTPVAAHVFRRRRAASRSLLVVSGGVDTWKVELHKLLVALARLSGLTVAAIDMPGTGESEVPLDPDGDRIVAAAVDRLADRWRAPARSFFGISFGGHWAAKLALADRVDAAIDLGGPVGSGEHAIDFSTLPNGMTGIVANALGLGALPDPEAVADLVDRFSLRRQRLLGRPHRAALLAVNGDLDPYVPLADTTVFEADPNATAWVVEGAWPRIRPPTLATCQSEGRTPRMKASAPWRVTSTSPSPACDSHRPYSAAVPPGPKVPACCMARIRAS
jgi:esterase FrsA